MGDGVYALIEALKANTTLTALGIKGVQRQQDNANANKRLNINNDDETGCRMGVEAARSLSEVLKANTTLKKLDLSGMRQ